MCVCNFRANSLVTDQETPQLYNLSMPDILSFSIRPLPFVTPRMLSCYTIDPIPPKLLPIKDKVVSTDRVEIVEGEAGVPELRRSASVRLVLTEMRFSESVSCWKNLYTQCPKI